MMSTSNGSSAVSAAPISVPSSMVPDSCSVTCTVTGNRLPAFRMASRTPIVAILACSKSCAVSISSTSTPPSIRAAACSSYAATIASKPMCPSDGSFVVGPIDPATNRGLSFVENCCATSFGELSGLDIDFAHPVAQIKLARAQCPCRRMCWSRRCRSPTRKKSA